MHKLLVVCSVLSVFASWLAAIAHATTTTLPHYVLRNKTNCKNLGVVDILHSSVFLHGGFLVDVKGDLLKS